MDLPESLRRKIARLSPDALERIKDRVRRRSGRMTPKRFRALQRAGLAGLGQGPFSEREARAKAEEILREAPVTESFDKQPIPDWPEGVRVIPRRISLIPHAPNQLVDIPLDFEENVKQALVEKHGIPSSEADVLAGSAVDRMRELSFRDPELTPVAVAKMNEKTFVPEFTIEKLSGMGQLDPEAAQGIVQKYAGWKTLVPLAVGAGIIVLWLKRS